MAIEPLLIVLAEDDDGHASLVQRNLERAGLANGLERLAHGAAGCGIAQNIQAGDAGR